MPANKVLANNARIISRTEKSVSAERNFYKTKKEAEEAFKSYKTNQTLEYEQNMTEKSNQYAEYWIYEKGDRGRLIINAYFDNKTSKDPCFINVYNKKERSMEKRNFLEVVKMIFEDAKDLPGNRLGQTRIWGDLYLSTEIYKFLKAHWEYLSEGSSEC
tara:strand:- start:1877 stop:2353 length:477 start_codon:yes stop_codon:yes gene_type:complete